MMSKTYFNWSTGKDSALALYYLNKNNSLHVDHLVTTVNAHYNRVSMHGLRKALLLDQVKALGLSLDVVELPEQPTMEEYNSIMAKTVKRLKQEGYTDCGFGDIFLEDLRAYREKQLVGINCHFPLWKKDTTALLNAFIDLGFKAIVNCINGSLLDDSFVGRTLDASFLRDLPKGVDPCGENGEFHTFCYDGPIFSAPVSFEIGEKIVRHYNKPNGEIDEKTAYWFMDLKPKKSHNKSVS
jgi:uncharacterized protein (TIGR00290 family)